MEGGGRECVVCVCMMGQMGSVGRVVAVRSPSGVEGKERG